MASTLVTPRRIPPEQRMAIAKAFDDARGGRIKDARGVVAERFGVGRTAVCKFYSMLLEDRRRGIDNPTLAISAFVQGTNKQAMQRKQRYATLRKDAEWVKRQRMHNRNNYYKQAQDLANRNRERTWMQLFRTMLTDAGKRRCQGLAKVTTEELFDLLEGQGGRCAISGLEMQRHGLAHNPFLASIDRIDSECGYQAGNVQLVCLWVNKMKRDFLQHEVRDCLKHAGRFQRGEGCPGDDVDIPALMNQVVRLYHITRTRSTQLKRDFDLDVDFLRGLMVDQRGRCALSGVPLAPHRPGGPMIPSQASIDRLDSSRGYTRDNVQFVALCLNLGKGNMPDDDFKAVLRSCNL